MIPVTLRLDGDRALAGRYAGWAKMRAHALHAVGVYPLVKTESLAGNTVLVHYDIRETSATVFISTVSGASYVDHGHCNAADPVGTTAADAAVTVQQNATTLPAMLAEFRSSSKSTGRERRTPGGPFKSFQLPAVDASTYAEQLAALLDKKEFMASHPSSMYSGRFRRYVQAIYGTKLSEWTARKARSFARLTNGLTPCLALDRARRRYWLIEYDNTTYRCHLLTLQNGGKKLLSAMLAAEQAQLWDRANVLEAHLFTFLDMPDAAASPSTAPVDSVPNLRLNRDRWVFNDTGDAGACVYARVIVPPTTPAYIDALGTARLSVEFPADVDGAPSPPVVTNTVDALSVVPTITAPLLYLSVESTFTSVEKQSIWRSYEIKAGTSATTGTFPIFVSYERDEEALVTVTPETIATSDTNFTGGSSDSYVIGNVYYRYSYGTSSTQATVKRTVDGVVEELVLADSTDAGDSITATWVPDSNVEVVNGTAILPSYFLIPERSYLASPPVGASVQSLCKRMEVTIEAEWDYSDINETTVNFCFQKRTADDLFVFTSVRTYVKSHSPATSTETYTTERYGEITVNVTIDGSTTVYGPYFPDPADTSKTAYEFRPLVGLHHSTFETETESQDVIIKSYMIGRSSPVTIQSEGLSEIQSINDHEQRFSGERNVTQVSVGGSIVNPDAEDVWNEFYDYLYTPRMYTDVTYYAPLMGMSDLHGHAVTNDALQLITSPPWFELISLRAGPDWPDDAPIPTVPIGAQ